MKDMFTSLTAIDSNQEVFHETEKNKQKTRGML